MANKYNDRTPSVEEMTVAAIGQLFSQQRNLPHNPPMEIKNIRVTIRQNNVAGRHVHAAATISTTLHACVEENSRVPLNDAIPASVAY